MNPPQKLGSAVIMLLKYRLDSYTMLRISKKKDAVPNRMILGIIDRGREISIGDHGGRSSLVKALMINDHIFVIIKLFDRSITYCSVRPLLIGCGRDTRVKDSL